MNELYTLPVGNFSASKREKFLMSETDSSLDFINTRLAAYHEAVMLMIDTLQHIAIRDVSNKPNEESYALETIFKVVQILEY